MTGSILLKNAHVIDVDQAIDRVCDVMVLDGKIEAIGALSNGRGLEELDLKGSYLSPGWIDIHVHAYGTLGFSDVDSIGVYQGVTSLVDAGDAGIRSLDEFAALIYDRNETTVYAGPHIQPLGIVGFEEGGRTLNNIDVERWVEWAAHYPDMLRYLKVSAFSLANPGPLYLAKGMADILGIPLYQHLGEMKAEPLTPSMLAHAFQVAQAGDIITHIYHNNPGKVLGEDGKVLPFVREGQKRGVLFDIGFGSMNFSWKVAETCIAQDLLTDIISSDLQQFNIVYPAHSLSNVMSLFFTLGLSIQQIIERVTINPARALKLMDRAGDLRPGQVADITVFEVQTGEFELFDCYKKSRKGDRKIVPTMAFRAGKRFDCNLLRGEQESNWFMQVAEEHIPARAYDLSVIQRIFLRVLYTRLSQLEWSGYTENMLNIQYAYQIQDTFHTALTASGLPLREGLKAVFACFLDQPFTVQIGLFLTRLDRAFVLERLEAVSARQAAFA